MFVREREAAPTLVLTACTLTLLAVAILSLLVMVIRAEEPPFETTLNCEVVGVVEAHKPPTPPIGSTLQVFLIPLSPSPIALQPPLVSTTIFFYTYTLSNLPFSLSPPNLMSTVYTYYIALAPFPLSLGEPPETSTTIYIYLVSLTAFPLSLVPPPEASSTVYFYLVHLTEFPLPSQPPPEASSTVYIYEIPITGMPNIGMGPPEASSTIYLYLVSLGPMPGAPTTSMSSTIYSYLTPLAEYGKLFTASLSVEPGWAVEDGVLGAGRWYVFTGEVSHIASGLVEEARLEVEAGGVVVASVHFVDGSCSSGGSWLSSLVSCSPSMLSLNVSIPWEYNGSLRVVVRARDFLGYTVERVWVYSTVNNVSVTAFLDNDTYPPGGMANLTVCLRYNGTGIPVVGELVEAYVNGSKVASMATGSDGCSSTSFVVPVESGEYVLEVYTAHGGYASLVFRVAEQPSLSVEVSGPAASTAGGYLVGSGSVFGLNITLVSPSGLDSLKALDIVLESNPLLNASYNFTSGQLWQDPASVVRVQSYSFTPLNSTHGALSLTLYPPWSVSGNHTLALTLRSTAGTSVAQLQIVFVNTTRLESIEAPSTVEPGEPITVRVRVAYETIGVPAPNETVRVSVLRGNMVVAEAESATDASGVAVVSLYAPGDPGVYQLLVSLAHGGNATRLLRVGGAGGGAAGGGAGGSGGLGGVAVPAHHLPLLVTGVALLLALYPRLRGFQRGARVGGAGRR